jgi:hypothetical protein
MQRESFAAGNKAYRSRALGTASLSTQPHISAHSSPQIPHHSFQTLEQGGMAQESITHHDKYSAPHPRFATHNPHCGLSQPEGRNMRRRGGERMGESQHLHANSVLLALLLCNHTKSTLHTCCYYCSIPTPGGCKGEG